MKKSSTKETMPMLAEPMERKAEVRVTIPPHMKSLAKKLNGLKIGKRLVIEVTGRIVALNMDAYETSVRMEITGIDTEASMGHQVEELRESRIHGR
jgi:bifunctional DNA-binding transcriptional regulator/antitoxin component of YhaV-PrlF toxin-antitoxin module